MSDPAFEEKYIRHHIVSHNATCKAETKFILSGLHHDILDGIKKPDELVAGTVIETNMPVIEPVSKQEDMPKLESVQEIKREAFCPVVG